MAGVREKPVVVNLDVAESLLGRYASGIGLEKVECV